MHVGVHAAAAPDKTACVVAGSGRAVTYGHLDRESNRLAQLLVERGLRVGDAIAIWMGNEPDFLSVAWAAQRSGLYYTPVSPLLTAAEAASVVNHCGARALVASPQQAERAQRVPEMPTVHTRLVTGSAVEGWEAWDAALAAMAPAPLPGAVEGRPMLYSAGTTGRPKGVRAPLAGRPLGAPDAATTMARYLYGLDKESVLLSPGPLWHAAPLRWTMAATRIGATAVLMERFDPLGFLAAVERHGATHTLVVPTMFVRLLGIPPEERARFDLSSLRCCVHGAAPCPVSVKKRMIAWWGPIIHEYYAGTEENGYVACRCEEWMARPGTVGRPILCAVHIVGSDGTELPAGHSGVVYFESATSFEYHNDLEQTLAARNERGWTTLGDIGHLDAEGYLYLTDRVAHTIVRGGVNVHPQEGEDVLLSHPDVADAAVFGVPHSELGEEVKAVVEPVEPGRGGPELERELLAFCRERLASYKCPKSIDFEPDLARDPSGKLRKRLLKARYWRGHDSDVA